MTRQLLISLLLATTATSLPSSESLAADDLSLEAPTAQKLMPTNLQMDLAFMDIYAQVSALTIMAAE